MELISIYDIERRAKGYFFSPDNMRFFASHKPHFGYEAARGGVYFVTSEQHKGLYTRPEPRMYTVRYLDLSGKIETVNTDGTCGACPQEFEGFQAYATSKRANTAARKYAEANHVPAREWHYSNGELVRTPLELTHDGA